jgi:hypothetical protein
VKEHEKVVRGKVVVGMHAVKENEGMEETVFVSPTQ